MSIPLKSFDIFITQDVFEHIYNPFKAFDEIARVLKPGGAHIFTVPWYKKNKRTVKRIKMDRRGRVIHLQPPIYHGNPIDDKGSLVTYDWGRDIFEIIYRTSKMHTLVYLHRDRNLGLDGEFLEVFISFKF